MSSQEIVDRVLATLTPERLRAVVEELAERQAPDDRKAVNIGPITDALSGVENLQYGIDGWEAFLKLCRAVRELAERTPGLKYVEVES